jgi:hypothetical protein
MVIDDAINIVILSRCHVIVYPARQFDLLTQGYASHYKSPGAQGYKLLTEFFFKVRL